MANEYLLVGFCEEREIYDADQTIGWHTNQVARLESGHHTITLSGPQNYFPAKRRITLQSTTMEDPLVIRFDIMGYLQVAFPASATLMVDRTAVPYQPNAPFMLPTGLHTLALSAAGPSIAVTVVECSNPALAQVVHLA